MMPTEGTDTFAMPSAARPDGRSRRALRFTAVFVVYISLTLAQAWPLPLQIGALIAGGPGDPGLNTAILWWNSTHVPFTAEWWNGLAYYPTEGVTAFTENLVGITMFFAPVYWVTGNAIAAYNVTFLVTWPLSAFTAFLLARHLTGRDDAACLAGFAFGFATFRGTGLGHVQTLASFWMPLCLLGLHGYLRERRVRWLWLFGVAWVLQSLANGHYMLFGAVLIGLWIIWFCSTSATWRAGATVGAVWVLASVPLLPVMNTYRVIHERFGLKRSIGEIIAYSARLDSWAEVSPDLWLWRGLLPGGHANLFPGITAALLVIVAIGVLLGRRVRGSVAAPPRRRAAIGLLLAGLGASGTALFAGLAHGPWEWVVGSVRIARLTEVDRALAIAVVTFTTLLWTVPRSRAAIQRRSPLFFYTLTILVLGLLCFGPVMRVGERPILAAPAPYAWLMLLPGFDGLRVPTRLWMMASLCLSIAAALSFATLRRLMPTVGLALFPLAAAGLVLDGWVSPMPMGPPSESWATVEATGHTEPILELPSPREDYPSTYRTWTHGRRTINGVSGHNPPHYEALLYGLGRKDPATLAALASLTSFEVILDRAGDPDGAIARYVAAAQGATLVGADHKRVIYRVPKGPEEVALGPAIPIVAAQTVRHQEQASFIFDGTLATGWGDIPQMPDQWIRLDLGRVHEIAGITHAIGDYIVDFPKMLSIDVSEDGASWSRVWRGTIAAPTVRGYIRAPREGAARLPFASHRARYVLLRQHEHHPTMWRVSEITVHAPPDR
jgi:hypothetical protein